MTGNDLANVFIAVCCLSSPVFMVLAGVFLSLYLQTRRSLKVHIADSGFAARSAWLKSLPNIPYRNEIEVEVKFIAPLVAYLGYSGDDVQVRKHIAVQVGRQSVNGEADWVLFHSGKPFVVIEAKEPNQNLDGHVQAQARSYAYALHAPFYLLTNGRELALYQMSTQTDPCVLQVVVADLGRNWDKLRLIAGK